MSFIADVGSALASAAGGSAVTAPLGMLGNYLSSEQAKKNQKDQWDMYYSPKAQVRNLAEAGINPAVAFGNNAPVMNGAGDFSIPQSPLGGIGTESINSIANYMLAAANAKKAGVDTRSAEEDIKLKQIEQKRNDFELRLRNQFGLKQAAQELALSEANVRLAQLSGDNSELEKAIKEYTKAKEKAMSEVAENQRDILGKELANKDTELSLSNRVLKTQGDSNIASANAANSQAAINRETRRLQSALADIEESGKVDKINSLISEYKKNKSLSDADAKDADIRLSRLKELQNKKDSKLFNEVDNFLDWIKNKVSIFH